MLQEGYTDVAVLQGGLGAWRDAGLPLERITLEARSAIRWKPHELAPSGGLDAHDDPFRSTLEQGSFLQGRSLPLRREMSVAFVDMAESTRLLSTLPTEEVLRQVQIFMEVVVDIGALHCGDVKDFEGDGALLYFEGVGESLPAAFEIRDRLLELSRDNADLPLPRLSVDEGPLVIGVVGGRFRRTVALIGPCVPRAARILKLGPPGGIIATGRVMELAAESNPDLASRFAPFVPVAPLRGLDETQVLYLAS